MGYCVTPNTPLPFINLAVQKRHLAVYTMDFYTKLNKGKSCINKKHPYDLIGELVSNITQYQQ